MRVSTTRWFVASTISLALAACGGGGDSTPTQNSITIAGTAVKGAALGGAAVSVKCATGTASTTSAASGTYTATVSNGALPCAIKVVGTDGTTYHSLVSGTGNTGTFTANLSPLTEMVVAHAAGVAPESFYSGFAATSTVSSTSVAAANAYVRTAVAGLTDLTGVNALTDPLVVGNALDQKIDALVAGLAAAAVTLTQATTSIVANPAAPSVVATPLAASAAACAWLKSGKYRVIDRMESDPQFRFQKVQIDATALTVTDEDGTGTPSPWTSDGSCQFNIDETDTTIKVLVSSGGMLVVHGESKTVATDRAVLLAVPEQSLPVSEFAGTWNVAAWWPGNIGTAGSAVAEMGEITLDAGGQVTASKSCLGLATCISASAPFAKFVANAAGGFDLVEDGGVVGRVFLYKTLEGAKVAVILDNENSMFIAVPKTGLGTLPAVGTVSNFRNFQINGSDTIGSLTEDSTTITAINSVTNAVTRTLASNNRIDMLTYDKPRDGLRYRAPNSCTIGGNASNCSEIVQLPLRGMGITLTLSAVTDPAPAFYQFSVGKP